jgi:hypothetical protein
MTARLYAMTIPARTVAMGLLLTLALEELS